MREAILLMRALQVLESTLGRERHLMCGVRSSAFDFQAKPFSHRPPNLDRDLIDVAGAVNQHHALGVALCQFTIGLPYSLIKILRLFLHPVPDLSAAEARSCRRSIGIEDKCDVRNTIAGNKGVQSLDQHWVEFARRTLVDAGGVEKAIANDPVTALERWLNLFPNQLAAAGFKQEEFRFRRHCLVFLGMLQQMPDRLADCRPARLTKNFRDDSNLFQMNGKPLHLRRFSTALRA